MDQLDGNELVKLIGSLCSNERSHLSFYTDEELDRALKVAQILYYARPQPMTMNISNWRVAEGHDEND